MAKIVMELDIYGDKFTYDQLETVRAALRKEINGLIFKCVDEARMITYRGEHLTHRDITIDGDIKMDSFYADPDYN